MSASLVGSEMCIRDSKPTPTRGGLAITSESVADVQGILISAAAAAESVSYTHLTLPTICSV
eukprot:3110817-Alexandrium_andersonii.AAC.1